MSPSDELRRELIGQVRNQIGAFAAPDVIHWASGGLPKTRSGKARRPDLRSPHPHRARTARIIQLQQLSSSVCLAVPCKKPPLPAGMGARCARQRLSAGSVVCGRGRGRAGRGADHASNLAEDCVGRDGGHGRHQHAGGPRSSGRARSITREVVRALAW